MSLKILDKSIDKHSNTTMAEYRKNVLYCQTKTIIIFIMTEIPRQ